MILGFAILIPVLVNMMYNRCMYIIYMVFLGVIGAIFGSFICCQVRRLRVKEKGKKIKSNTSVCLNCGYKLKWYDNIPIVSWVMLGGKCRKCGKKIGALEIMAEMAGVLGFVLLGMRYGEPTWLIGVNWPMLIPQLVFYCILLFLALYDAEYGVLPTGMLVVAIICGAVVAGASVLLEGAEVMSVIMGVVLYGGTYFLLYKLSHERLVGGGDWMLGTAIALGLADWWLSLFAIFLSNMLAAVVMVPVIMIKSSGKKKGNTKVFFGPWMVVGYVVVLVLSEMIVGLL